MYFSKPVVDPLPPPTPRHLSPTNPQGQSRNKTHTCNIKIGITSRNYNLCLSILPDRKKKRLPQNCPLAPSPPPEFLQILWLTQQILEQDRQFFQQSIVLSCNTGKKLNENISPNDRKFQLNLLQHKKSKNTFIRKQNRLPLPGTISL